MALLLLIRDLCTKLSAVVHTVDFNKAAERELPAGGTASAVSLRLKRLSTTPTFRGQRLA